MSPAEELRTAAAKLREAAKSTTPGSWDVLASSDLLVTWQETGGEVGEDYEYLIDEEWPNPADPKWAALISPVVAEPLAAWLEDAAEEFETYALSEIHLGPDATYDTAVVDRVGGVYSNLTHALAVARIINGTSASSAPVAPCAPPGSTETGV